MAIDLAQSRLVAPSLIQLELTRIWDSLEGAGKMRASLFNLIFYTSKTERTPYIHTIAKKVVENFPSRVIFITSDKKREEDFLETRVSVISSSHTASNSACDWIEIDVSKKSEGKVPFLILPHLLTDLPLYLVWAEDATQDNPLLYQLEKWAARLIFDSECTEKLPSFAKTLLKFHANSTSAIADLNWGRIESWRDLLSSTFYSPDRVAHLKNTKTIQIFYNAQESDTYCHTPVQAIYLQGWIASQLEWKLKTIQKKEECLSFLYQKKEGEVEVVLYPEKYAHMRPGAIISVDLTTKEEVHFSFGRDLKLPHQISMRFSTLEKCAIPLKYLFAKAESGQSLVREISHKGTSSHYLKLLHLLNSYEPLL